jgi:hypothetical protein
MNIQNLKRALRAAALLALFIAAQCGRDPKTYESPSDCSCRIVNGKRVCNSACG